MFSIVIPFYNKHDFLQKTITSLKEQIFKNFEVIFIDDGSKDKLDITNFDTEGLKYHVVFTPNQGVSVARNTGASLAVNRWILFLDAGDYYEPHFLDKLKNVIGNTENIKLVASSFNFINIDSKEKAFNYIDDLEIELSYDNYLEYLLISNYLFHICSLAIDKNFFFNINGFRPGLTHGEDHEFILKSLKKENRVKFINDGLFNYCLDDPNSATQVKKKTPIYGHIQFLLSEEKLTDNEIKYLMYVIVDNLICNIKNGFIIYGLKQTFLSIKLKYIFIFGSELVKRVYKYAKK
ncbi:TPA: glycosyltransferase family 2 protein [Photobacterium damselae]